MEIAFQAFGNVLVWVRMRVRELVSERARKHPRNKMCGIRILNAFVALHGLLLEGAFSLTWAQVKVRVRSFFPDMHFGEKKNGWKSKREKVNVERGTYSHRRTFNTTAFSIPNLAFISHFSNVILYFAASHTQKLERKREHTCLFHSFSQECILHTISSTSLTFHYISHYRRIREHVLSRQTRKSKMY